MYSVLLLFICSPGLTVTVFALVSGAFQMKTGDIRKSQKMMRLRVGAQAFTLLALIGGVGFQGWKNKRQDAKKLKESGANS